jgi:hypothetical protein
LTFQHLADGCHKTCGEDWRENLSALEQCLAFKTLRETPRHPKWHDVHLAANLPG